MGLGPVVGLAFDELRRRSKLELYRRDYVAWKADVLGARSYEKMNEIAVEALFGEKRRTAIASANGTGKSREVAYIASWAVSVFEPGEILVIALAPSTTQLEQGVFTYLKDNFAVARSRGHLLPGWIDEQMHWNFKGPAGKITMLMGRSPAKGAEVATVQGTRGTKARVLFLLDEAGAPQMGEPIFSAVQALMTGANSRTIAIGNPDAPRAYWRRFWTDPEEQKLWNTYNISAYDLPWNTGERVYPDPEVDRLYREEWLTGRKWVEDAVRTWKVQNPARFKAKVLGEFTDEDDNSFFSEYQISRAFDTVLPGSDDRPVLGVDVARMGLDETVVVVNDGGRIRKFVGEGTPEAPEGVWGKTDVVETARRVHDIALRTGARLVNVDASGIGGAVFDVLDSEEYADKPYAVMGLNGAYRSPNPLRWVNARAWQHAHFRDLIDAGLIDLDPADKQLRREMEFVTWKVGAKSAEQITSKDELRKLLGYSPDALDAVIYSCVDPDELADLMGDSDGSGVVDRDVVVDVEGLEGDPFLLERNRVGMPFG